MIKDQAPIGSDKQKVQAFIDNFKVGSLKITREDVTKADAMLKHASGGRDREKIEELGGRIAEYGAVVISDAETGFLYYSSIFVTFYIDKDGKLIDYTVKKEQSE